MPAGSRSRLRVERSGGFIGRTESAEVDLDDSGLPDLRDLVERADLAAVDAKAGATTMPDMYLYTFTLDDHDPVRVPEHRLTTQQAELARRVLQTGPAEM